MIILLVSGTGCIKKSSMDGKTTVTFTAWVNTPDQLDTYHDLIEEYEKENPSITVEFINTPYNGYREKIFTMSAGGNAPDIITINNEMFVTLAHKGLFKDIRTLTDNDADFDLKDFYPITLEAFQYKGRMLGIPRDFGVFVMYYNKDIFKSSGVSYPPSDRSWTWKEFLDTAVKLTKDLDGDGHTDQYGALVQSWMPWWAMYIWQNNGSVLNKNRTKCVLNSPEAKEAMQFVADMVLKYKVSPTLDTLGEEGVLPMVQTGKIAMFFIGPWERRNFRLTSFHWDVAPMITGKKCVAPLFVDGYAVAKTSKHPVEAWKLIKYIISKKGMTAFTKLGFATPARMDLANSDVFLEPHKDPKNAIIFLKTLKYGRMLPVIPQWDEMGGIIVQRLELILNTERAYPVGKGLDEITRDVNKLLQQNK